MIGGNKFIFSFISRALLQFQPKWCSHCCFPPQPLTSVNNYIYQTKAFYSQSTLNRVFPLPKTTPDAPPVSDMSVQMLSKFLKESKQLVLLTGAGISTESGVPDYRSPKGAYSSGFKPMMHHQYVTNEGTRRRYWARSYFGWKTFSNAQPSNAHKAITRLQKLGYVSKIVTQNVDRLHQSADAVDVLELHGTVMEVICMQCNHRIDRRTMQNKMTELNPEASEAASNGVRMHGEAADSNKTDKPSLLNTSETGTQRPDGDIELSMTIVENFMVPPCSSCGGILKPDVVFFGGTVPKDISKSAMETVLNADGLLIVGSSVMVYSAFRLAKAAHENSIPIAIVSAGPTRADEFAFIKAESLAGPTLSHLLRMKKIHKSFNY